MSHDNKRSSTRTKKTRLIDELGIKPGVPVELAVWLVNNSTTIECKHIPTRKPVTFMWEKYYQREVEGEIITVTPTKVWQYKGNVRFTGEINSRKLDINAFNLTSLPLEEKRVFDPDIESDLLVGGDDPFDKYYIPIMVYGPRKEYELKQMLSIGIPDDCKFTDPFSDMVSDGENRDSVFSRVREYLVKDFRCMDAHAVLGNLEFNVSREIYPFLENKALRHYLVGMRIAELSLGHVFHDLLPWEYKQNRPYLRCLYGYGLCLWRNGKIEEAKEVLEKMLWLNPRDEQGCRFLLEYLNTGKKWEDMNAD